MTRTRRATRDDTQALLRLRALLWPEEDADEERAYVESFFAGTCTTTEVVILAEDDDGDVVGFAELSIRSYVPGASSFPAPFLEGWFVVEHARGRGVGRALVEAGERWARERGFTELGSDTLLDNTAGQAAHAALGFDEVERLVTFVKRLVPGDGC